jgi:hypothetical protein
MTIIEVTIGNFLSGIVYLHREKESLPKLEERLIKNKAKGLEKPYSSIKFFMKL